MLIDTEPKENDWLTANKLIEQNIQFKLFLKSDILNLYSIMVRKHDFHAGERLLQRLPYITLPLDLALTLRKQSLILAERCYYYFNKTALDYSIKKWQQKIIDYTENQHRLPFPLFRLSDYWQEFLSQEYVPFQSARGERFHLPTTLSNDLAYFLGVVIGDGHLNYHNIELVDFSQEQMLLLQSLGKKLFGIVGAISGEKKIWLLHLNNKWLVRLANFLTDQPITGKKYPALREPLIFQRDKQLRWQFWSGVLDADGSYINVINLCSSSEKFILEFAKVLDEYCVRYTIDHLDSTSGQGFALRIKATSKAILGKYLQPRHPKKIKDFLFYLSRKKKRNPGTQPFERLYIYDFNPQTLIHYNGATYFNFELFPSFFVTNCSKYLQTIRKSQHWTQQDLADYLEIPKGRLASYEYRSNLPIPYLKKLLPFLAVSPTQLMPFLTQKGHYHFRSRKSIARLDLEPSNNLLSLMKSLVFCKNYLLVRHTRDDKNKVYTELRNHFEIAILKSNMIQNSILHQYAKTFFLMKPEEY
ncbi:MAG: helix-turn-helix domain-containing protein [Candidatus Heimdallarchaeota archaeon]|nr:helix-turn-helix domain-containing protein [Candidatus Heimdallarchaeota archaeon]